MFEYKVLSERDGKFSGTFDLDALEATLTEYAHQGWRLAEAFVAANFVKSARAELVVVLERASGQNREPPVPVGSETSCSTM